MEQGAEDVPVIYLDGIKRQYMQGKEPLIILDGDLTVPPEQLPKFWEAIRTGKGEFINGSRLVYPMDKQAMRFRVSWKAPMKARSMSRVRRHRNCRTTSEPRSGAPRSASSINRIACWRNFPRWKT